MSDPTVSHQTDQNVSNRPRLTLDTRYPFRGFWDDGGVTRVRVFEREDHPPVVIFTELAENENTSITNVAEHIAPEFIRDQFPHRAHESPPAIFLECYSELLNNRRRRSGPSVSRVSFAHMRPVMVQLGGVMRLTYGEPSWTHLDASALAELIGEGVDLDGE